MFVDDMMIPGSLWALTIRAPIAKGRFKGLECPHLPFGYTLIQSKDIPGTNHLDEFSVPILAAETLSYIGEPVALLVGSDMGKLQEYAAQCRVIADEDKPVFFEDLPASEGVLAQRTLSIPSPQDVPQSETPSEGIPHRIIQGTYQTGIQEHWYTDPQGAVAVYTGERGSTQQVVIHTPTQWPFHVKRSVSQVLQVPLDAVTVEVTALGVHLDGKLWYSSLIACQAALGAYITGKPVKLILTREEDFRYSPKRHRTVIAMHSALGKTGEILETEITLQADLGAQGVFTDEILDRTCLGSLGAYRIPLITLKGKALTTNIPPQGPFAGFGLSQGFFAIERQVSRIADALHQDPAAWRKQHIFPKHRALAIGVPVKAGVVELLIDMTAAKSDYYRKWAAYELLRSHRHGTSWAVKDESLRGIGIALAYQGSGFLYPPQDGASYGLEVTLEKAETLEIRITSCTDTCAQLWRKIAGEILSIEEEHIRIHTGTAEDVPDAGPASNSRYSTELTPLLETACQAIQKQRFQDPLPITVRQSYQPSLKVPWEGNVSVPLTRLYDEHALARLGWGVAVVEVAIDPIAYTPKIRGIWLGIAGGRVLSEKQARLALSTGAIQALGWAAQEQLFYTKGKIPEPSFYTYGIPDLEDIPLIQVDFIGQNTSEPKGIGELPFSSIPAAYVQAVSQAMDHPFETIPLGAQAIWEVENQRKKEAAL
ncbi:MAG: xanthine dehydrogenase family protein molybdopterin-binding subunit [Treponema sp.]|nr:xanthine dehydrogenase family protein molybdopterin-binding subunit [Treponema sp.]